MVITICMSMSLRHRLPEVCRVLEAAGHSVLTPVDTKEFDYESAGDDERAELKREKDLIRTHYEKIKLSDTLTGTHNTTSAVSPSAVRDTKPQCHKTAHTKWSHQLQ